MLFFRSVQGDYIGIQICGCRCEQMSALASKGNGTSRPTLTPRGLTTYHHRAAEGHEVAVDSLNK